MNLSVARNRDRREILRGIAALAGTIGGTSTASGNLFAGQKVALSLPTGVVLFDLNGDGEYVATVERASISIRDDAHPRPIHVTSNGQETVDYAASIVEPESRVRLGDLDRLTYDYYEGTADGGSDAAGSAPGETFLGVENDDARHGMYLTYDAGTDAEQWQTHDVLARMNGDTEGTSRWFEYTSREEGYECQTFDDVIERFGPEARLVRVGVGHGNAVAPTSLDVFYDSLVVNDGTRSFPASVAKRVSRAAVF
jgi:hypothetical protein